MEENISAASQWDKNDPQSRNEGATDQDMSVRDSTVPKMNGIDSAEIMKRRGFFEAISEIRCPMDKIANSLREFKSDAEKQIATVDGNADMHIAYLNKMIEESEKRLVKIEEELHQLEQYDAANDSKLLELIRLLKEEEHKLHELQKKLTEIRIKMGELKSTVVDKSLHDAEAHVRKAIEIEKNLYDETKELSQKRFEDEKHFLTRLAQHYQRIYDRYEIRYKKTEKQLDILDADGISPATTRVLATIGSTSFVAAGFFFSVFVGATGLGTQDILSLFFGGLIDISKHPLPIGFKILFFLVLLILVTSVSWLCNKWINRLKRSSYEEVYAESDFDMATLRKLRDFEYQVNIKSNNWYALWLQILPGILIGGLLLLTLAISKIIDAETINRISTSSEGLFIGMFTAMSVAGLIYLYVIKIVEPRLLKKYESSDGTNVNWLKANRELIWVLLTFLLFSICIITIPYSDTRTNLISVSYKTRYSLLLFVGLCLVGGTSFAYGVRSNGLITTGRFLERAMLRLNDIIACCTGPQSPGPLDPNSTAFGLIIKQVLAEFSLKMAAPIHRKRNAKRRRWYSFGWLADVVAKADPSIPAVPEPNTRSNTLEPWEVHYFPAVVEELKAVEEEYSTQKSKVRKANEDVDDFKAEKQTKKKELETEKATCRTNIKEHNDEIKLTREGKAQHQKQIWLEYHEMVGNFMDGVDLGMWYRENGMGPVPHYFDSCNQPVKAVVLINDK